jgi:DUF4097 and DUF4098 domain-containing protein YvlB
MFLMTAALLAALSSTPLDVQNDQAVQGPQGGQATQGSQAGQAKQGARRTSPPDTDETVAVTRGARLSISNFAGEVFVHGWDRDSVRVQARHNLRSRVTIRPTNTGLTVSSSGSPGSVDYDITVPAWMPVKIEGTYIYIAVEGTQADVAAETVRGDISIKGGTSFVTAKSVEGEVILDGVRGKVNANSVNQGVTVNGASGELVAETVNGHITLNNIESTSVDVGSVNGNIKYDGVAAANGRYRFSTHNGSISVGVPESSSAAFSVRTYNGSVRTDLQLQGGGDVRRGQRAIYTLGSGSAEFEVESFGGTIQLRRRGSDAPLKPVKAKEH